MALLDANIKNRVDTLLATKQRVLLGLSGPPGAGKSTFADLLASSFGPDAVVVPMDGFHLSSSELKRLGRLNRKGAPDTFDSAGFLALVKRLSVQTDETIYAPFFSRAFEEPIAGAIPIFSSHRLLIVEGNYLLCDGPWQEARLHFHETWYLDTNNSKRHDWLKARHMRYGRDEKAALEWISHTDEPNAALIRSTMPRADFIIPM